LQKLASIHQKQDHNRLYHFAIIDFLQFYTVGKRVERAAKSVLFKQSDLSVAPPDYYGDRFIRFLEANLF
jgi:hypothetical protein